VRSLLALLLTTAAAATAAAARLFLRDGVKAPLAIGDVLLDDGSLVKGFVGESYGVVGAPDISQYGGWRAYLADQPTDGEKPATAPASAAAATNATAGSDAKSKRRRMSEEVA
jgi:hypothetical protein